MNINALTTADDQVRAVCECCGRTSPAHQSADDGRPDLLAIPVGWSEAPYPVDYQHADGSRGSLFACPLCNAHLRAGARLSPRQGYPIEAITGDIA